MVIRSLLVTPVLVAHARRLHKGCCQLREEEGQHGRIARVHEMCISFAIFVYLVFLMSKNEVSHLCFNAVNSMNAY